MTIPRRDRGSARPGGRFIGSASCSAPGTQVKDDARATSRPDGEAPGEDDNTQNHSLAARSGPTIFVTRWHPSCPAPAPPSPSTLPRSAPGRSPGRTAPASPPCLRPLARHIDPVGGSYQLGDGCPRYASWPLPAAISAGRRRAALVPQHAAREPAACFRPPARTATSRLRWPEPLSRWPEGLPDGSDTLATGWPGVLAESARGSRWPECLRSAATLLDEPVADYATAVAVIG